MAHINHFGSICFGALIITIIKVIRFLFVYLAKQAVKASGQEDTCYGKIAKCFIACGDCILRCFEKIVDYINNSAYAYMSITGESFCTSAMDGFLLNMKHAGAFGSAKYFATALIFLGKFGVTALNCFTAYALLNVMSVDDNIGGKNAPIVFVGLITYLTCEVWLTLFDQAILGIMMSYAVDYDINDGQPCRGPETFNNKRESFQAKERELKQGNDMKEGGFLMA